MRKADILIVEDEQRLAGILSRQLQEEGFSVDTADDGFDGKKKSLEKDFDLIILDLNLPLLSGYELCREIRLKNTNIPIIMLTALGSSESKLTGFDAGADDYIIKPFDFRELLARINVFLRRTEQDKGNNKLVIADLVMDIVNRSVYRSGRKIELTVREFKLLEIFLQNKEKLLTREFIIEKVWGIDFDPSTNIIDVYINYLRKKIDRDFEPKLIHTKFGFGFYLSDHGI
ncbi:MAG: response regulator transcription factor [Bacteroidales bacterium]